MSQADFNPRGVQRKAFQSGANDEFTQRYRVSAPMFNRIKTGEKKPPIPPDLHPWVAEAARRSSAYYANPDRPRVFSWEGGRLQDIRKSTSPLLQQGDVVLFTFTFSFIIGAGHWWPQVTPIELVRVAAAYTVPSMPADVDRLDFSAPIVPSSVRRGFVDGEMPQGELFTLPHRCYSQHLQ